MPMGALGGLLKCMCLCELRACAPLLEDEPLRKRAVWNGPRCAAGVTLFQLVSMADIAQVDAAADVLQPKLQENFSGEGSEKLTVLLTARARPGRA